jgi:hypothetical protein
MPGNRIVFHGDAIYAHAEFMYSVVLCSRSFQQFLERRRGTEGSTEGHYTDWALAHHMDARYILKLTVVAGKSIVHGQCAAGI